MHWRISIKDLKTKKKDTLCEQALTYPMDVLHGTRWQIVINDHIYSFEVNPSS